MSSSQPPPPTDLLDDSPGPTSTAATTTTDPQQHTAVDLLDDDAPKSQPNFNDSLEDVLCTTRSMLKPVSKPKPAPVCDNAPSDLPASAAAAPTDLLDDDGNNNNNNSDEVLQQYQEEDRAARALFYSNNSNNEHQRSSQDEEEEKEEIQPPHEEDRSVRMEPPSSQNDLLMQDYYGEEDNNSCDADAEQAPLFDDAIDVLEDNYDHDVVDHDDLDYGARNGDDDDDDDDQESVRPEESYEGQYEYAYSSKRVAKAAPAAAAARGDAEGDAYPDEFYYNDTLNQDDSNNNRNYHDDDDDVDEEEHEAFKDDNDDASRHRDHRVYGNGHFVVHDDGHDDHQSFAQSEMYTVYPDEVYEDGHPGESTYDDNGVPLVVNGSEPSGDAVYVVDKNGNKKKRTFLKSKKRRGKASPIFSNDKKKSERRRRRRRWCWCLCCCLCLLLLLLLLFFGLKIFKDDDEEEPHIVEDESEDDNWEPYKPYEGVLTTPMEPYSEEDCYFDDQEFPNVHTQCECYGNITKVPPDVIELWYDVKQDIAEELYNGEQNDTPWWSCDPGNIALIWLSSGDTRDSGDLFQRYINGISFSQMNGTQWDLNNLWLSNENECLWLGIQCTGKYQINSFALDTNNVQ
jgi:hypothetical protein